MQAFVAQLSRMLMALRQSGMIDNKSIARLHNSQSVMRRDVAWPPHLRLP